MKILHFILGKANPDRANGVNQVIHGLAKYQSRVGHEVHVLGISNSMTTSYEKIQREEFEVECFKKFNSRTFSYLKDLVQKVDLVHLHGVWNMKNVIVGRYLETIGKPYVITAHCGYAIDRLKQSNYWLKLLYHTLWQKRLYKNAAGVHALTREEQTDLIRMCGNSNTFVVSNGVDSDTYDKYQYVVHQNRKKIKFGYLGRISVEKNINNLIKAVSLLPTDIKDQIELCLIGPITENVEYLQHLAKELKVEKCVKFVGARYGEEKIETLLDLDFYIHPAYSDVVGIAVMEALALGIPTIVTRTSHMSYFNDNNAFIMVEPTAQDLSRGIKDAMCQLDFREHFSNCAKNLYMKQFNWKVSVELLIKEYERICV